jgi:peptidoglycan/LPS O-acetylase OafA/YrhL
VSDARTGDVRRLGRRAEFNGLRGVWILAIVLYHATNERFVRGALIGVDMFFLLSGFLITALLLDEYSNTGRISLRNFYMRRILRLFPALLLFLAGCLAIYVRVHGDLRDLMTRFLLATGLYFANIAESTGHSLYWAHTWTLSAEEQFYLVWPALLIVLFRSRLSRPQIVAATVGLALTSAVLRAAFWRYGPMAGNDQFAYYNPATHADSLLLGCALGQLFAWNLIPSSPRWRTPLQVTAAGCGLIMVGVTALVNPRSPWLYQGGLLLIIVLTCFFFIGCFDENPSWPFRPLRWAPFVYIGQISYGLYLWNPVFLFNYPGDALHPVVGVALALGVSVLSFHLVEAPALRLKSRFATVRHQKPVVVEPASPPRHASDVTSAAATTPRASTSGGAT